MIARGRRYHRYRIASRQWRVLQNQEGQDPRRSEHGHDLRRRRDWRRSVPRRIIELDHTWTPGTPVAAVYNLESDAVLEIGLTPNRTDGMSHYGVVRDLRAGLLHGTVEGIKEAVGTVNAPATASLPTAKGPFELTIETGDGCPRYLGLLIEGVRVGPSPDAIQQRLRAIGVNPQNNVVDATNYVLHEMGQPLHAFDADAIEGNAVVVRHPHPVRN